jgi:hypothetical protein
MRQGLVDSIEASTVQTAQCQPKSQAIVNEQFHAVAPDIDKGVGTVRLGVTKAVNDASEYAIHP